MGGGILRGRYPRESRFAVLQREEPRIDGPLPAASPKKSALPAHPDGGCDRHTADGTRPH